MKRLQERQVGRPQLSLVRGGAPAGRASLAGQGAGVSAARDSELDAIDWVAMAPLARILGELVAHFEKHELKKPRQKRSSSRSRSRTIPSTAATAGRERTAA